jgi:RNA exonuclease 1
MFPALGSHLTRHKYWTCCDQHCTADPCSGSDFHDPHDESLEELTRHHQLHYTPVQRYDTGAVQTASNGLVNGPDIRAAVAVDCEMGTAESGDTELIRVTLIDYFTGEILVNNIVEPDVPLRHLNTKYSGVTWGHMREAQRKRTSLKATPGARNAIWRYVGAQTIVVGHGVSNDLRSMKWIHEHVVDSLVIELNIKKRKEEKEKKAEDEAIAKAKADGTYVEPVKETSVPGESANEPTKKTKKRKGGDLSLKTLVDRRLGRKIQLGEGTTGHDSLEDAIAARDLVHWHINNPSAE